MNEQRTHLTIDIPVNDDQLFRSSAMADILLFLTRNPDSGFSITDIAEAINYSRPTVTNAVDILATNDLVIDERDGASRRVQINPEHLFLPDNPFFQIPQAEYREPARVAVDSLTEKLDDVIAVILYGSVAKGEADRRSDIDLWVLVTGDRMANQQAANRVRSNVEAMEFDEERYAYDVDVEGLQAIPNYRDELREILTDGIALFETAEFETVRQMVLHGDGNE